MTGVQTCALPIFNYISETVKLNGIQLNIEFGTSTPIIDLSCYGIQLNTAFDSLLPYISYLGDGKNKLKFDKEFKYVAVFDIQSIYKCTFDDITTPVIVFDPIHSYKIDFDENYKYSIVYDAYVG